MEKLNEFFEWAFSPDSADLKHQGALHPIFAIVLGVCTNLLASFLACKFLMRFEKFRIGSLPLWGRTYVKKFMIFYLLVMAISRYYAMSYVAFYDILWTCNGSMINLVLALYLDFPLLVIACVLDVSVDQLMWIGDIASYLMYGKFEVGVMSYLMWPQTSWAQVLTGTHHLWFMPLCFLLLRNYEKFHFEAYFLSAFVIICFCGVARMLTPKEVFFPDKTLYLNVNSIWDSWKDVSKYRLCSLYDSAGTGSLAYFLWVQCFWNTFNLLIFLPFKWLHQLIRVSKKEKIQNKIN